MPALADDLDQGGGRGRRQTVEADLFALEIAEIAVRGAFLDDRIDVRHDPHIDARHLGAAGALADQVGGDLRERYVELTERKGFLQRVLIEPYPLDAQPLLFVKMLLADHQSRQCGSATRCDTDADRNLSTG